MGEVIAFKRPDSAKRLARAGETAGEILFFMGVRRERIGDAAPPEAGRGKSIREPSGHTPAAKPNSDGASASI